MNNKFDEMTKGLAQSVTRRGALKKFGVGLAGMALALLGFASNASANPQPKIRFHCHCGSPFYGCDPNSTTFYDCELYCGGSGDRHACGGGALVRLLRKLLP